MYFTFIFQINKRHKFSDRKLITDLLFTPDKIGSFPDSQNQDLK